MPQVTVNVSAQFPHPPIQFLSVSPIAGGTYAAGDYTFTRPAPGGLIPVDAFGFGWSIDTFAPPIGFTSGILDHFDRRAAQIVVRYKTLDGTTLDGVVIDSDSDGFTLFETFPEDVRVRIEIGFGISFFWLILI